MGEVLEGIKGKRTGKTYKQEQEIVEVDDFEFYLKAIKEFSEASTARYGSNELRRETYGETGLFDEKATNAEIEVSLLFPKKAELLESYQELASLISNTLLPSYC